MNIGCYVERPVVVTLFVFFLSYDIPTPAIIVTQDTHYNDQRRKKTKQWSAKHYKEN
jgi:hypothetical protein